MSLYRRKDSPYWWSSIFIGGVRRSVSTGERTKAAALRRERDLVAELEREAATSDRLTLATCCAKLIAAKEADGRTRAGTLKMLCQHIRRLLPAFGADRDVRTIDLAGVKAWAATRDVAAVTLSKELSTLRQVLGVAVEMGAIDKVPVPKGPRVRLSSRAWRILTREELARLLDELVAGKGTEAAAWYVLAANTGMRPSEQGSIAWEWINMERATLALPGSVTKTHEPRMVTLNQPALAALEAVAAMRPGPCVGRVWWQTSHRTAWERACERAKVGHVRPYDLRHTFASLLHADGQPLVVIRDALGHAGLAMVSHYAHTFDGAVASAVANVATGVAFRGPNVARNAPKRPARKAPKT